MKNFLLLTIIMLSFTTNVNSQSLWDKAKSAANSGANDVRHTADNVAKATKNGANAVAKGTNDVLNHPTSKKIAQMAVLGITCYEAINDVEGEVEDLDPREWMEECAEYAAYRLLDKEVNRVAQNYTKSLAVLTKAETGQLKEKAAKIFIECLASKIKTEIAVIEDPVAEALKLYGEMKNGCQGVITLATN
jgi:hypothetical protein